LRDNEVVAYFLSIICGEKNFVHFSAHRAFHRAKVLLVFHGFGAFHFGNITLSALAVIPSLLGMWVGTAVRERISAATFRRWFLIFLAILGLELVVRPFFF